MKDELQPRVGSQVHAIGFELGRGKTRKQVEIRRLVGHHSLGEQRHDLRKTLTVPQGVGPVHRRRDKKGPIRERSASLGECGTELLKSWINSKRNDRRTMDTGEEVGDAGNDAGGRLRADLLQCGTEDRRVPTSQNLSCLQSRIGTNGVLVHMVSNVRIADQCKDRGHLEFFLKTFFWIKFLLFCCEGFRQSATGDCRRGICYL